MTRVDTRTPSSRADPGVPGDLLANASEKMVSKKLDMIVANDISATDAGFDVEENRVTILTPDGQQEKLSLRSKFAVSEKIIIKIAGMLEK